MDSTATVVAFDRDLASSTTGYVLEDVDEHNEQAEHEDDDEERKSGVGSTQDPSLARGQKRPLHQEDSSDFLASTSTRDLPAGVSIVWQNEQTMEVTFSSPTSEQEGNIQNEPGEKPSTKTILLCLVGRAKIKCMDGQVEILGYCLTPETPDVSVSSPYWSSWLTMEVIVPASCEETTIRTMTRLQISSIRGSPSFRLATPIRPTIIPPSWRTSVEQICRDVDSSPSPVRESLEEDSPFVRVQDSIIMISGAKGVGKSTLMRYMTNRLLQLPNVSSVAILDADVGQPELAPPGMLSLNMRRRPLLQPPYWNLCDSYSNADDDLEHTVQSIYYGAVTSKVDPTRFLDAMQRLIQAYRKYMAQTTECIPLIINLDGWVKGMGFEILTCLIATTRPSHMCQIVGDTKAKTFDLSEAISSNHEDHGGNQTQLFYLDVCSKFVSPFMIPSSSLRTIRLCAYFGPQLLELWDQLDFLPAKQLQTGWSDDQECLLARTLARERPYCVPFEAMTCIHANTDIHTDLVHPPSSTLDIPSRPLILQALNGNIVGLCTEGQQDCVGLGIVRSIDWDRELMFVLTPIVADTLPHVTVMVCGNIPLPPPMVFRGVYAESFPYLTTMNNTSTTVGCNAPSREDGNKTQSNKILGSEPMKSRNNISRRSFAGTKN